MKQSKNKLGSNFKKLIIANSINRFGDSVETLALTWLVYIVTNSAFWSAFYFMCNQLPSVLVQPFAGAIVETLSKKKVMFVADIVRGILVTTLIATYYFGVTHPVQTIVFTLFISTIEAFRIPAGTSLVPMIVEKNDLDHAISRNTSISKVSELAGLGVAGLITASFGVGVAMIIDMVTFFLSALLIFSINVKEESKGNIPSLIHHTGRKKLKNYHTLFVEGLRYSIKMKSVSRLIIFVVIFNGLFAPINSLLVPLISGVLELSSIVLSSFSILLSVGTIAGALLFPYLSKKSTSDGRIIGINGVSLGVMYVIMFILGTEFIHFSFVPYGLSAIGFLLGFNITFISSRLTVSFMKQVDQNYLSRVGALYNAFASAAMPLAAGLISLISLRVSVPYIYLFFGLISIIVMSIILFANDRIARNAQSQANEEEQLPACDLERHDDQLMKEQREVNEDDRLSVY